MWYQHPSWVLTLLTKWDQDYCWLLDIFQYWCRKQKHEGRVMSLHLIWLLSVKLGSWSCQPWYQHPSWVLTLLTKRDSGILLDILHYCCGKQNEGGGVTSLHLIWLLSIKLGSWSCQPWYQHPSRVLILLTKQDSGLLLDIFHYHCGKQNQGRGMMSCLLIWLLSVKLGSWSCQVWYQHPSRVLTLLTKRDSGILLDIFQYWCGKQKQGGRGEVSPFDLIAPR